MFGGNAARVWCGRDERKTTGMAIAQTAAGRQVIRIEGDEARDFLHGLVTCNVETLAPGEARYGALLTPQGKLLADFILVGEAGGVLLDVAGTLAGDLARRFAMYKLRRKLAIAPAGLEVVQIWGEGAEAAAAAAEGVAVADPRDAGLGLRVYAPDGAAALAACLAAGAEAAAPGAWEALRIEKLIPETGAEIGPETYILEAGFERLGGVDFRKGCYVGQEIVARMKHKIELRRGLMRVAVEGEAPTPGTEALDADGRPAGVLGTVQGGEGLALLRFDRAEGALTAGEARLRRL